MADLDSGGRRRKIHSIGGELRMIGATGDLEVGRSPTWRRSGRPAWRRSVLEGVVGGGIRRQWRLRVTSLSIKISGADQE